MKIDSVDGVGTTVTIVLPRVGAPSWYVEELPIGDLAVVAIDDDEGVLTAIKSWFRSLGRDVQCFQSVESFFANYDGNVDTTFFLIDYEITDKWNGVDFIEFMGIEMTSVLVTGRAAEGRVQTMCVKRGLKLLSKEDIGHVRITALSTSAKETA